MKENISWQWHLKATKWATDETLSAFLSFVLVMHLNIVFHDGKSFFFSSHFKPKVCDE